MKILLLEMVVFVLFFQLASTQNITIKTTKDSLYVYDNFSVEGTELSNLNGSSGKGWSGNWTYIEEELGVIARDGLIYGNGDDIIIKRNVLNPIILQGSVFYTSFLAAKTSASEFGILAGRLSDDLPRFGIGITRDGKTRH